jgi:hypothetical protein
MNMDKWEWDRKHIRENREKHNPYTEFEKMMMDLVNQPFSVAFDYLTKYPKEDKDCFECMLAHRKGKIKSEKTVLPSGLRVITRRCTNPDCPFFEETILTDENEILDFQHWPKEERGIGKTKFTEEEIKQIDLQVKKIEKILRKERMLRKGVKNE